MAFGDVDNNEDILNSDDIEVRISELEEQADNEYVETHGLTDDDELPDDLNREDYLDEDDLHEYKALRELRDEAEGSPDWKYGETLIRESYFTEYAQQLAEDVCEMPDDNRWPFYCIDWEWAARELKHDYMSVDFDGITYLIRA